MSTQLNIFNPISHWLQKVFCVTILIIPKTFYLSSGFAETFLYFRRYIVTVFERIEKLRKDKKISQGKLEKELGFSNGSISKWRNSTPTYERLQKVADYFGVSVDYLMTGTEDKKEAPVLTARDERDITKSLDHIMSEILSGDDGPLYYNGQEIDQASLSLLRNAFEFALRETKKENKEIYNPHKNKG